ncbi:MAG: aminoacyl-tRNA hydrolase [Gemmatimonadaceae bacterium]|nr:aminoacyl-tRNA hydrolase [Gemmatimonadaceae bacterium]
MAKEGALAISESVSIPRGELVYRASRAGGAGGQHVNTSSTRIELLWNVAASQAIPVDLRDRVASKLAARTDGEGWVRVVASNRRSQGQNKEEAEARLTALIRAALIVPKKRRPTKPTRGSMETRIAEKKKRGETKRQRRGDLE